MLELSQTTINTILLALVAGLLALVARIFWAGINNFRKDIGHLSLTIESVKMDMADVRIGVAKIDTWKDGKDKLDVVIQKQNEQRLNKLEERKI